MDKKAEILIVDDDFAVRKAISLVLKDKYGVATAEGAEEALKHMADKTVNLVLLDIKMSKTDGITALKEIKERFPETKVIMVTAYATQEKIKQSFTFGAFGILMKPFDAIKLLELIEEALGRG